MNPSAVPDADRHPQQRDTLCALVAIKSRAHCKSRLAGVLAETARRSLVRSMLQNVLEAVQAAHCVDELLVVSPERDGVPDGTTVICDSGHSLNAALTQAHARLHAMGHAAALILPADLPHLGAHDIETFVQAGWQSGFAIAADGARRGTNGLFLGTRTPFTFRFGADSLRLHLQEAALRGLSPRVLELPGLAFDVDEPADLAALGAPSAPRETHPCQEATWQTLARI